MAKVLHLSKLSRGHVELSESGSRLEIFADKTERPLAHTSRNNLPRTYTTKRGPLILFAETGLLKNSRSKIERDKRIANPTSLISPPPLKFGELKRSILAYGGTPENQFSDGIVDEDGTFIHMKIPSKKRHHPPKYAGINPNVLLKRRYIVASTEDKRRDLDSMLDSDFSNSRNHRYSIMKTHILSDEISLIPPIYRNPDINQHSPSILSDTYRFFKIEKSILLHDNENTEQLNSEPHDTLQIIDSKGSHLSYQQLEQSEKEKILADLLIQTALQNIFQQQNIEVFEDALNRVRDSDINNSYSSIDMPTLVEENCIPLISSDTTSDHHHHHQTIKSHETSSETSSQQQYMFGKMPGSKWARNRSSHSNTLTTKSKHETNETEQQFDRSSEHSQTTSDYPHSKLFHASRLLAPITTSSNQDSSSIRSQQHYSTKLPIKLRKTHDIDYNQHKIIRKDDDDDVYSQHLPSLNETPQNRLKNDQIINEKEKLSRILFSRQRSSKSSKQNPSRLETGKTLTTNRCVSSPLSLHEEAERLLAIDSSNEDDDNSILITNIDATEDILIRNEINSAKRKTDDENDEQLHPSETNEIEDLVEPSQIQLHQSAYTHRSHATTRSKASSNIPHGAFLIAPDGEVLSVGGPTGHLKADHEGYLATHNQFAHQPSTASAIFESTDDKSVIIAPCVPMVLGTKRERLPGETVVRRTLNLTSGDFNSQIGLQSWSYEVPIEKRHIPSQPYTLTRPPPPSGMPAFTGRKYHYQKRVAREIRDHAMLNSTFAMHSEVVQQQPIVPRSNFKNPLNDESQAPRFPVTSWTYQRPQLQQTIKRPYLYRPDYRPSGAHGHKHHLRDRETLIRRTINVHAGDIDASLSFTIWVYDLWINDLIKNGADPNYIKQVRSLFDLFKERRLSKVDLQNKEFLTALANHAQALARIILKRSDSGYHLAEDAQFAIIENIRNLKYLLDERLESVSDDVYRDIFRDTLQHVLKKGSLENLQITDEILMALMDYPIDAFEIYLDSETNEEYIRIKNSYRVQKNKIKGKKIKKNTKTIIMSEEITVDYFERIFDQELGEYVYRFKKDIAQRKDFTDLMKINFDIKKNNKLIQIKSIPNNFDFKVEIFNDPDTGKQMLVWRKEVPRSPTSIQSDISNEDFELITDEQTGETIYRLKNDVAIRKGLTSLSQTNFDVFNDPITGETVIRIKNDGLNQMNNDRVEIITDVITGKQTIRKSVDDIDANSESNESIVTIIENDIDVNDFERIIDPLTGREFLRMKADVLKAKGLEELANAEFEIIFDDITGQRRIILKTPSSELNGGININFEITIDIKTGKQKIIKKIITEKEDDHLDIIESQLSIDDFECIIDPKTGREVLQLRRGAAARKGLTDLLFVQFEMVTDADGKQTIVVKGGGNQGNTDDGKFELITDASGRTTIKIKKERPPTPELEVTEKPIDINDFEEIIDPKTGLKILKLKLDVAKRTGMMELLDAQFETYIDTATGKQAIRIKQNVDNLFDDIKFEIVTDTSGKQVLKMVQEIPKTIEVTNSDINVNDFEEIIDEKTGEKVLRMKKEVAERKGFIDMDKIDFELIIDEKTGQEIVQIKNNNGKLTKENGSFEIIIDPITGQQTLRMKQEIEIKFEKIENDLSTEDFEETIDQITGERVLKLTAQAAAKKGLNDLRDIAFEVYVDPTTGKEQIRIKDGNQTGKLDGDQTFQIYVDQKTGQQKIVVKQPKERTLPPLEKSIDINDFEKIIDPNTGKESYRLTDEAIRRKGLTNVKHIEFDVEIDSTTGKTVMKPKVNTLKGQNVEVIIDKITGEQVIRVVQEKPIQKLATITTTIDLDKNAFSIQIDPKTGKQIVNLSKNLIENYGLENIEFEQIADQTTGKIIYQMKPLIGKDGKIYELITDPITGKQSLQVKETVTQKQLSNIIENREAKGLKIPILINLNDGITGQISEEQDTFPTKISSKKKDTILSPDGNITTLPVDKSTTSNRRKSQVTFKSQSIRIKSSSDREYEIEWTADDEKEIDGLDVHDQRKRKEQILAEKKRKVAEMKRQENLAIQHRLKKQRESLVSVLDESNALLNKDEQEHVAQWERDLRKLDTDREGLTEDEYQLNRKKLFDERTRLLKGAYDRKMDGLKGQTDNNHIDDDETAQLEGQISDEEELLLSMMNPDERARQRLLAERERVKREEELQAALAETKRMATERAAEIMAKELQKRSVNSMYAELKDLVTEQKVSRAFTYSYFSLLQFLPPNPVD